MNLTEYQVTTLLRMADACINTFNLIELYSEYQIFRTLLDSQSEIYPDLCAHLKARGY